MKIKFYLLIFFLFIAGCYSTEGENLVGAAVMGDLTKVKRLLKDGANINYRAYDDWTTPLIAASTEGHLRIVDYLISSGAEVNLDDGVNTPLYWALVYGHLEVAKYIKEHGGKIMNKHLEMLTERAKEYHNSELNLFIKREIELART